MGAANRERVQGEADAGETWKNRELGHVSQRQRRSAEERQAMFLPDARVKTTRWTPSWIS